MRHSLTSVLTRAPERALTLERWRCSEGGGDSALGGQLVVAEGLSSDDFISDSLLAMATAADEGLGAPTRLDRRKARTRKALLDAAKALMVERGTTEVSIQEITDRADVGFGSFYNHFTTKAELFEAAVAEVLKEHGARLDDASAGIEDPAEVFAVGVRTTARLVDTHPVAAQVMVQAGLSYLTADQGLAPRAARDLKLGLEAGRFTISSPQLGRVITAGCLLAYLQVRLHRPGCLTEDTPEELAERILVMLGVNPATAHDVAHRPLPAAASA